MDEMENLGKRLKALRTERDLTLDMVVYDINKKFGIDITKGNLSRWENGVNVPSLRFAGCLAQYFSVSLDYLIGLTNIRTPVDLLAVNRRQDDSDLDTDNSEESATKDDN